MKKPFDFDAAMIASGALKNNNGQWIKDGKVVGLDCRALPTNDEAKEIIKGMLTAMGKDIPEELK